MSDRIVALDVETLPRTWSDETINDYITQRANRKRTGKGIEEKKSLFALDFPFLNKPVQISLAISPSGDSDETSEPHIVEFHLMPEITEANMLTALQHYLNAEPPDMLVTYNGFSFDLPILRMAYLMHKLDCPFILIGKKKYSDWPHYDIMQELAGWAYGKGFPLHVALHIWGIAHDDYFFSGMSGGIATLLNAGEAETVNEMCSEHARVTYNLYKRLCPTPNEGPFDGR